MTAEDVDAVHKLEGRKLVLEDVARELAWQSLSAVKQDKYREQAERLLVKIELIQSLGNDLGEISKLYA